MERIDQQTRQIHPVPQQWTSPFAGGQRAAVLNLNRSASFGERLLLELGLWTLLGLVAFGVLASRYLVPTLFVAAFLVAGILIAAALR